MRRGNRATHTYEYVRRTQYLGYVRKKIRASGTCGSTDSRIAYLFESIFVVHPTQSVNRPPLVMMQSEYTVEERSWGDSWWYNSGRRCRGCHRLIWQQRRFLPLPNYVADQVTAKHQCEEIATFRRQRARAVENGAAASDDGSVFTDNNDAGRTCVGSDWLKYILGLIVIVVAVSVGATLGKRDKDPPTPTLSVSSSIPTLSPSTRAPFPAAENTGTELQKYVEGLLPKYSLAIAKNDSESPQARALEWLVDRTDREIHDDYRIRQRYALAVLFHSTDVDGNGWTYSDGWQVDPDECLWWYSFAENICTDHKLIILNLFGNNLIGTFPTELELMTAL
jgi:hypothetical protein